ncbi:MFS transporter [Blastomyces dermatitidis ER-3]|uniref:MFS transporter n=2 Tax=Blastomyces TaxID=229219 RepID=A0A179UM66_BLAGS|nr:MFS transporter [Blastomyces gilchristii SLH14081]XP_045272826.1 MFS transporter [Blastomyces dermatitidis ER-3]EEQ84966.1 MFS transporter [Blastomyces dermatitidis ER-3]EQL35732.1 hypothetical protein BDFG_02664 [Blastomyces dermatitidis ATCC 26199]OAT07492.1 MFS transporter [Blastomyces gilchristii SLH14081]
MDESTDELIRPEDFPLPNRSQESLCSQELISWNITPPLPALHDPTQQLAPPAPLSSIPSNVPPSTLDETQQLGKNEWESILLFFTLAIVAFVGALDATSLPIALPTIAREFNASTSQSFWVGISFLLTVVLSQPIHTGLSGIFGRKEILYLCLLYSSIGSVIAGFSKSIYVLIVGRALQGFGAGSLETLSEVILGDFTTPEEHCRYLTIFGFIWAAGFASGPLIGATFAEYVDWRWIPWINIPLLAIPIMLVLIFRILKPIKCPLRSQLGQIDWPAIALFIPSLSLLTVGVTWTGSQDQWDSIATVVLLALGILFLVIFIIREGYARTPIFPYWLLTTRSGFVSLFGAFMHGAVLYSTSFFIPIYLQATVQLNPVAAATNMLPLSVLVPVMALATTFASRHLHHHYDYFIWTGWFLTTLGIGILILLDGKTNTASRLGLQVLGAMGLGILLPALGIPLQERTDGEQQTEATMGNFIFARQLGAVVGVSLGSRVFSNAFSVDVARLLPLPEALSSLSDGSAAVNFIPSLKNLELVVDERRAITGVYERVIRTVWIVITVLSALGLLSSILIRELRVGRKDSGKQALQG